MSIYGNSIFEEKNSFSNLIVEAWEIDENGNIVDESVSLNLSIKAAKNLVPQIKTAWQIINLATVIIYTAYNMKDLGESSKKVRVIEDWYERNDKDFIKFSDLEHKVYACKKFFDGEYAVDKELTGKNIFAKLIQDKFYPDKAHVYFDKDGKAVFTYFDCYDLSTVANIAGLFPKSNSKPVLVKESNPEDMETITQISIRDGKDLKDLMDKINPKAIKAKLKKVNNKFFFQMTDKSKEKYKYYYLSRACLKEHVMTREARNWVEREYKRVKKESNKYD